MSKLIAEDLKLTARDALAGLAPTTHAEESGGLSMRKLVAAAFRSRYLLLGLTLLGLLIGSFLALTTPNSYLSTGSFRLSQSGSEAVRVDLARPGETHADEIGASATYVLTTDELFRRVITRLTPEKILAPYQAGSTEEGGFPGFLHRVQRDWNSAGGKATVEDALRRLKRSISIDHPRYADVLITTCTANDPQLAQEILATYMEEARKWHIEKYDDPAVYDKISKSAQDAREERKAASRRMSEFLQRQAQVDNFDFELKHLQESAYDAKRDAEKNELEIEKTKSEIHDLVERLGKVERQIKDSRRPDTGKLKDEFEAAIAKLRTEQATERAKSRPDDPDALSRIGELEQRIRLLYEQLNAEVEKASKAEPIPVLVENPEYKSLGDDIAKRRNILTTLEADRSHLTTRCDSVRTALKKIQDLEPQYLLLRDALQKAEDDVAKTANALAQAEIKRDLRLGNFSSLNPLDSATLPLEKEGPNRMKLSLGGLFAGLFLGLAIVILRALPDNVVRMRDDVERIDGVQVIGVMPRMDNRNIRRHRWLRLQGW